MTTGKTIALTRLSSQWLILSSQGLRILFTSGCSSDRNFAPPAETEAPTPQMSKAERSQGPRETSLGSGGLFIPLILQSTEAGPTLHTKHCFSKRQGKDRMLAVLGGQAFSAGWTAIHPFFLWQLLYCHCLAIWLNCQWIPSWFLFSFWRKKKRKGVVGDSTRHPSVPTPSQGDRLHLTARAKIH